MWRRAQKFTVPVVGEVYGYRARAVDELVPVKMLKEGTRIPARVLIRFEHPAMKGREEWVPPARLKVSWSEVEEFRAEEARWDAVEALSPGREAPELYAAEQACSLLLDEGIAGLGYKDAHLVVHDVAALARLASVEEAFVSSHPAGFNVADDGPLVVPWPVAIEILRKAIRRNPEPVLAAVTKEEAEARYEGVHGHRFSGGARN